MGARTTRREALRQAAGVLAGSRPRATEQEALTRPGVIMLPTDYPPDVLGPINLHEFEDVAKTKINRLAYDYIAAGAADDLTLQANREAFGRFWFRRRVMIPTTIVDTSVELLGQRLEHPIMLAPFGAKALLHPDGDNLAAKAARHTGAIYVGGSPSNMDALAAAGEAPTWWAATLGHDDRESAQEYARRINDTSASAIAVSVDYQYTGARDRPSRHEWDPGWIGSGNYSTSEPVVQFQAGMIQPYAAAMTWEWMNWMKAVTNLPIIVKGIVTAEDAALAVEHGADVVSVSNHGGRTLDGMGGTLDALPEVVDAVGGRVPVLMDGGVRRGGDVLKALALGATAILIGRPYMWALGAFGQDGVQRVVELLHGEFGCAMGLAGTPDVKSIDRSLIRAAWKA
jgi:isopentenyl diphosphate isomerase/L-lactate dehydrogenase-like FMN-dependent dehydrogenase